MKVTLVPYGNIPKVTVSLALRSGNIDETADKLGVADITGELMKEGTKTMSSEQVAHRAESGRPGEAVGRGIHPGYPGRALPATCGLARRFWRGHPGSACGRLRVVS